MTEVPTSTCCCPRSGKWIPGSIVPGYSPGSGDSAVITAKGSIKPSHSSVGFIIELEVGVVLCCGDDSCELPRSCPSSRVILIAQTRQSTKNPDLANLLFINKDRTNLRCSL